MMIPKIWPLSGKGEGAEEMHLCKVILIPV